MWVSGRVVFLLVLRVFVMVVTTPAVCRCDTCDREIPVTPLCRVRSVPTPPPNQLAALQRSAAVEWLSSPAARNAGRGALRRCGAPSGTVEVEDLLQAVALKVLRRLDRGPLEESGLDSAVVAYLNRACRNEAVSILRGHRRRNLVSLTDLVADRGDGEGFEQSELADDSDPVAAVVVAGWADAARRAASVEDREPWLLSAVLTRLTVALSPELLEPGRVARSVPLPGGAGDLASWVALVYAGKRTDLPSAGDDDAARRKRRSRAIARVDALLREVLAATGGADA